MSVLLNDSTAQPFLLIGWRRSVTGMPWPQLGGPPSVSPGVAGALGSAHTIVIFK